MSTYSDNTNKVLESMGNIVSAINEGILVPLDENVKNINKDETSDDIVEAWSTLETKVLEQVEEAEIAWAFKPDTDDSAEQE